MPNQETDFRTQDAVLWEATGAYDEFGRPVVGTAKPLKVRWEWGRSQSLDPKGNTISIDARVVVDRVVKIGSRMWLGKLADVPGTAFVPERFQCEVKTTDEVPDIKGRATRRTLGLVRLHDDLS